MRTANRLSPVTLPLLVMFSAIATYAAEPRVADRIVIEKSKRTMMLMKGEKILKAYRIALGSAPLGRKERMGDHKTPEGHYVIDARNPQSRFHLSLHISYPNRQDRDNAKRIGVDPGGAIMIHGIGAKYGWLGPLHRQTDWTDGCVAVTNEEIEEIWRLTPIGAPVDIRP